MSGRCKACDRVMSESEIIWNDDAQLHEELCRKCRNAVHKDLGTGDTWEHEALSNIVHLDDLLEEDLDYGDD